MARYFRVHPSSFYRWIKFFPQLREAVDTGRAKAHAMVAKSLFDFAQSGGKEAVTACIFWLCNRHPGQWQHVNKVQVDQQTTTTVHAGADKDPTKAARLAEHMRTYRKALEEAEVLEGVAASSLAPATEGGSHGGDRTPN
jgi:hypothetical protein